jgi:hypothetical protein
MDEMIQRGGDSMTGELEGPAPTQPLSYTNKAFVEDLALFPAGSENDLVVVDTDGSLKLPASGLNIANISQTELDTLDGITISTADLNDAATLNGTQTLTNKTIVGGTILGGVITAGTAQTTGSGTSFDFTSIPSWVKKITVMFSGVTIDASGQIYVRIGDSGGIETSGYSGGAGWIYGTNTCVGALIATRFPVGVCGASGDAMSGSAILTNVDGNTWVLSGSSVGSGSTDYFLTCGGSKTLTGTLDRVQFLTSGIDAFTGGTVNILYEG